MNKMKQNVNFISDPLQHRTGSRAYTPKVCILSYGLVKHVIKMESNVNFVKKKYITTIRVYYE